MHKNPPAAAGVHALGRDGRGLNRADRLDRAACDGSLLTNPRQFGALTAAKESLSRAGAALRAGITPDAVLTDVEQAMQALGEVTGRTVREDITNRIFERFCVGK